LLVEICQKICILCFKALEGLEHGLKVRGELYVCVIFNFAHNTTFVNIEKSTSSCFVVNKKLIDFDEKMISIAFQSVIISEPIYSLVQKALLAITVTYNIYNIEKDVLIIIKKRNLNKRNLPLKNFQTKYLRKTYDNNPICFFCQASDTVD